MAVGHVDRRVLRVPVAEEVGGVERARRGFPLKLKVWIVSRLVRIGLVGKNSDGCSATTFRNEMEVNTK